MLILKYDHIRQCYYYAMLILANANAKRPKDMEKSELLSRSLIGQKFILELSWHTAGNLKLKYFSVV